MLAADRAIIDLAERQHGAVSRDQAMALGVSRASLRSRQARGLLVERTHRTYTIVGSPQTWRQSIMVAVLSLRQPGAASHQTAAELHGLTAIHRDPVEVITRHWERRHRVDFTVHESRDLLENDIVLVGAVPTTTPERTVVDLAANAPRWLVARCLDTGLRDGILSLERVEAFVGRVGRRGRRGVGRIRPLLKQRRLWSSITESTLEDRFRALIDRFCLPQPIAQHEVTDQWGVFVMRADFAYLDERVLVELDGAAYHSDRASFRRDREKQNRAVLLGWKVLRFTWWDLSEQPEFVANQIHSVLA